MVSSHHVPGPHTLTRPASQKKQTSAKDARVLNRKLGDQWLQTHPTAQRLEQGQEAHENMHGVDDCQTNANQNCNEASPHTHQNGRREKVYK